VIKRTLCETLFDESTVGSNSFSGPIVIFSRFAAIQSSLLENIGELDLSKDQKYLYDICDAVDFGFVSQDLANLKPRPVVHTRRLTTACRILRLYVGTTRPTKNLKILVKFILNVYAPMSFEIKTRMELVSYGK
jgi:hypothetical protein